ncbi:hypothetical protein PW52_03775 [Tamlana sedimentorum]|uniref:Glycosyl transferase family 1 n=1 Tax=Neotamlana sedimentorum TaxID=1435349 RepID=A0A0D7WCD0_9FLAO|nr:glycosyltransferase [Tamlana sedimentorum]KJD36766.1 hypothetical protein PW52_03775 [Tamlana sedimentorum]
MGKIKVAHILHSVGGVEVYLDLVAKNIDSNKFETIIIHGKSRKNKQYFNKENQVVKQFFVPMTRDISIITDLKCVFKTIKILKREKPNLIHAHSAKGGIIARLASLFYKVHVLHTPHAYSYLSTNSKLKRNLFLVIEQVFKSFNSILLATSESELERGINEVGYKNEKAYLFNNSIKPIKLSSTNQEINYSLPNNYICTVGRPSFQKNIEMMVEVIQLVKYSIPNIHMVVMGLGVVSPNTENVKQLIREKGLESNFTLIEWMEREKALKVISNSGFYLSTSRYEGLPYAIIESLALSKAIIATNCDGNKDLVKNNFNGFLTPQKNKKLTAEKVIELLNNLEMRKTFERNSFELFENNFNIDSNISKLENIYLKFSK